MTPDAYDLMQDRGWRKDRLENDSQTMEYLQEFCDGNGVIKASTRRLARVLGHRYSSNPKEMGRILKNVQRRVNRLKNSGDLTIEGSMAAELDEYGQYDWQEPPTITLAPEYQPEHLRLVLNVKR